MVAAETMACYFLKRKCYLRGKIDYLKKNFYFTRETTEVLGKVQFLKSYISSQISISNPFNIIHIEVSKFVCQHIWA